MSSNLLLIGKSGVMAARSALDLTAQNIANVDNPNYARRTLSLQEVAAKGGISMQEGAGLSGVRTDRVMRSDSLFLQNQARLAAGDLSRAEAELVGLTNAETIVEQSGIYSSIVDLEASLSQLASDPLSAPLRTSVLEDANRLEQSFAIAENGLDIAEADIVLAANGGVDEANQLAAELARTNEAIALARPGSSNAAALFDQRDAQLRDLTEKTGAITSFDTIGRATVSIDGQQLVSGNSSTVLTHVQQGDGSFDFAVGGNPVNLTAGSLLGHSQAGRGINDLRGELDSLANQIITIANGTQASGDALDGSAGQPFFSGTGFADFAVALTSGSQIATAPSGAGANSRDISNLQTLRDAFANGGPAETADTMLFSLSSAINAREITREALGAISQSASAALSAETGVDLDQEATNLLRYQQAFQANGRVIQVASDIFNTILGIG